MSTSSRPDHLRRTGDTIPIEGDYQYRALTSGNAIQRFWHYNKQLIIQSRLLPQPQDRVLDVGCGSGVITDFLSRFAHYAVGYDGNQKAIEFARRHFVRENLEFRHGLVDDSLHLDCPVDKIYCMELIEHIYFDQARAMLMHFYSLLKPGGYVFLTTPNYASFWPFIELTMDLLRLAPRLMGQQHVELYHRRKLKKLYQPMNFKCRILVSYCFLAPFLAPLNRSLAEKLARWENHHDVHIGSLLVCILQKEISDE